MKVPLSSPDITEKERKAVLAVLKTPQLSLGPKLVEFENTFAKYIGTKHAIAVNSGTSALHLSIRALAIGEGDEVITTPFSFIASANCALFEQAKPVFVDIREDTLNLDETQIEKKITKRTKAILPVHVFGYPADMAKINKIAKKRKLKVIEDSCEAIGAQIGRKKVGNFSDCAVFAFYPNKQMTTGEGGMVVTNDDEIAMLIKSMRNQGRDRIAWHEYNRLGYNYRLSEMNCALGIAQLKRLKVMLKKREAVANIYDNELLKVEGVEIPPRDMGGAKRSWFVYVIRLKEQYSKYRDRVIEFLKKNGIGASAYFPPIHLQPFYAKEFGYKKGDFPVTEKVAASTIALPFFNNLTTLQVNYVVKILKKSLSEVKSARQA